MSRIPCHLLSSGISAKLLTSLTNASFTTSASSRKESYKFLIAGGGTGGITMAARILGLGEKSVAVIEPSEFHYYQPYWTLVGGHKGKFQSSYRMTSSVMPKNASWIKDKIVSFDPSKNKVYTERNGEIEYEFLIVALGINLVFDKIKGLPEAFETKGVCSNYSSKTVSKTAQALEEFVEGNAIFTQPVNPIKCAGAPQKIMYLAEEYFAKNGKREKANIVFNTALGTIFSCPKYAAALKEVAKHKNISVNYFHSLVEVNPGTKEAVFDKLDDKGAVVGKEVFKYEMLHIAPPMTSPRLVRESAFSDSTGFLDVNKNTLQSKKFDNVFGIGDCTNVPTSKTAAAIASQCGILTDNIRLAVQGKVLTNNYYGYTSCPFVTGYNKGILAEFNYELKPEETLPIDQAKERRLFYFLKAKFMPYLYWNFMLKGYWSGPKFVRKLLHLWMA